MTCLHHSSMTLPFCVCSCIRVPCKFSIMARLMDHRRSIWLLATKSRSNACAVTLLDWSTDRSAIFSERILRAVSTYNSWRLHHYHAWWTSFMATDALGSLQTNTIFWADPVAWLWMATEIEYRYSRCSSISLWPPKQNLEVNWQPSDQRWVLMWQSQVETLELVAMWHGCWPSLSHLQIVLPACQSSPGNQGIHCSWRSRRGLQTSTTLATGLLQLQLGRCCLHKDHVRTKALHSRLAIQYLSWAIINLLACLKWGSLNNW